MSAKPNQGQFPNLSYAKDQSLFPLLRVPFRLALTLTLPSPWGHWPQTFSFLFGTQTTSSTRGLAAFLGSSSPERGLTEMREPQEEKGGKKLWVIITSSLWVYLLHGFSACWMWLYDLEWACPKVWNTRTYRCFCNATEVAWGNKWGSGRGEGVVVLSFWFVFTSCLLQWCNVCKVLCLEKFKRLTQAEGVSCSLHGSCIKRLIILKLTEIKIIWRHDNHVCDELERCQMDWMAGKWMKWWADERIDLIGLFNEWDGLMDAWKNEGLKELDFWMNWFA